VAPQEGKASSRAIATYPDGCAIIGSGRLRRETTAGTSPLLTLYPRSIMSAE
jgi:hypothetical protein